VEVPRALVLGAGLDPLRGDARRYAERLAAAGVDATYLEYADTPHAFLNFPGMLSVAWQAMRDIADDLEEVLGRTRGRAGRRRAAPAGR
jgi:acetyl esterase